MERETRRGILRTEFVTHNARFGMLIVEPDELIERICDAMDEQDARDTAAPTPTVTTVAGPVNTTPTVVGETITKLSIFTYALVRAHKIGGYSSIDQSWALAAIEFAAENPDPLIKLLREQFEQHETRAEELRVAAHSLDSADRNRGEQLKQADKIRTMLDRLARDFGTERVWGAPDAQATV